MAENNENCERDSRMFMIIMRVADSRLSFRDSSLDVVGIRPHYARTTVCMRACVCKISDRPCEIHGRADFVVGRKNSTSNHMKESPETAPIQQLLNMHIMCDRLHVSHTHTQPERHTKMYNKNNE